MTIYCLSFSPGRTIINEILLSYAQEKYRRVQVLNLKEPAYIELKDEDFGPMEFVSLDPQKSVGQNDEPLRLRLLRKMGQKMNRGDILVIKSLKELGSGASEISEVYVEFVLRGIVIDPQENPLLNSSDLSAVFDLQHCKKDLLTKFIKKKVSEELCRDSETNKWNEENKILLLIFKNHPTFKNYLNMETSFCLFLIYTRHREFGGTMPTNELYRWIFEYYGDCITMTQKTFGRLVMKAHKMKEENYLFYQYIEGVI